MKSDCDLVDNIVLIRLFRFSFEVRRSILFWYLIFADWPNKAVQPTPTPGMPAAYAPVTPASGAADLRRSAEDTCETLSFRFDRTAPACFIMPICSIVLFGVSYEYETAV